MLGRANADEPAGFPNLAFPFPDGQEWTITCAYADGSGCEHADNQWNRYALDFQRVGGPSVTEGQPVRASASGEVTVAEWGGETSFGWYVKIGHGRGYETIYAHMQAELAVVAGEEVAQGQVIGYTSCTGRCTGPHIHFVMWLDGDSVPPEPMCGHTSFDEGQIHTNCAPQAVTPMPTATQMVDTTPGLTPTIAATATPAPPPGDGNCDRAVNSIDAALILQFDAGLIDPLPCLDSADTNRDGAVNPIDAALILQLEAGLFENLTPDI
jgi:murein DD-endopeptidase MepM/ murein hydrolase activator NlpD